ncbi:MAG: YraN family protein [Thermoanaerobaculaceae bacterium]
MSTKRVGRKRKKSLLSLGSLGELLALVFLWLKGYRLEARNWRARLGELDLVLRQGSLLVFVEVKTRSSRTAGLPEQAVDLKKQQRLGQLARAYLLRRPSPPPACRFDVIAVDFSRWLPRLRHYPGAFVIKT